MIPPCAEAKSLMLNQYLIGIGVVPQRLPQQVSRLEGEAEVIRCCPTTEAPLLGRSERGGNESGNGTRLLEAGGPLMWPIAQYAHPRGLFRDENSGTLNPVPLHSPGTG